MSLQRKCNCGAAIYLVMDQNSTGHFGRSAEDVEVTCDHDCRRVGYRWNADVQDVEVCSKEEERMR